MKFSLIYSNGTSIPYPTSTLFVFNTLNELMLDVNDPGVYSVKLRVNYDGIDNDSGAFTLIAYCSAYSTLEVNFPPKSFNITIPYTLQNRQILYGNETWRKPNACPMTYELVRQVDSLVVTGTWLTVDAWGQISVDVNTPGYEDVKLRYTYDGTIYYSNAFQVNVSCTSFIAPTYLYQITRLFHRYESTYGRTNLVLRDYATELSNYIDIEKCLYCWNSRKVKFTL